MPSRTSLIAVLLLGLAAVFHAAQPERGQAVGQATFRPAAPAATQADSAAGRPPSFRELDAANPAVPLPEVPLGHDQKLTDLPNPPQPEKVRLGRWLFFDKRLSVDGTVSCASCHRSAAGFSDPVAQSTGVGGKKGKRKAPSFINVAFAFFPEQFWDGRAASLQEQAKGPMSDPSEMGTTHDVVVKAIGRVPGYAPFFERAFGDPAVTLDRITEAIADYERTRVSGNSPWDRWRRAGDESAVSAGVKLGDELFFGKANCAKCHVATVLTEKRYEGLREQRKGHKGEKLMLVGNSFTDWRFHNIGIGWDAARKEFADKGRFAVTGRKEDMGAFKTPGLRDVELHPPYMHDGSLPTLEAVVEHYRRGGIDNPYLDSAIEPLELTDAEAGALVTFMKALSGEGYQDAGPSLFPQ